MQSAAELWFSLIEYRYVIIFLVLAVFARNITVYRSALVMQGIYLLFSALLHDPLYRYPRYWYAGYAALDLLFVAAYLGYRAYHRQRLNDLDWVIIITSVISGESHIARYIDLYVINIGFARGFYVPLGAVLNGVVLLYSIYSLGRWKVRKWISHW